jgi:hypothetical protein
MNTEPTARTVSGSQNSGPPSENIGTRDTLSTPPAAASSRSSPRTRAAAVATASIPDAQKR